MTTPRVQPTTDVPADGTAARCPYCDRPFTREQFRDLHVGNVHPGACTPAEEEAYEAARDEESDELFMFHLKVIAAIMTLYAGMIIIYMVVLGLQTA